MTSFASITPTSPSHSRGKIEDAEEVKSIWNQIQARVIQLAGGDPNKIKPNLTVEDVLEYIEKAQMSDKKSNEKYESIKGVFNKTLQCIQHIGSIVAEGASEVLLLQ